MNKDIYNKFILHDARYSEGVDVDENYSDPSDPDRFYKHYNALPSDLSKKVKDVNKYIIDNLHKMIKKDKYKLYKSNDQFVDYINEFSKSLSDIDSKDAVQLWPIKNNKYRCMIQITGHVINNQDDDIKKVFHKLLGELFKKLKYHIQKNFDMRLDYEYNEKNLLDGFDVYTSPELAKKLYDGLNGIIKESYNDNFDEMDIFEENTEPSDPKKCKHVFSYAGGQAKCDKCGWFVQPNGDITRTATRSNNEDDIIYAKESKDNSPETGNKKLSASDAEHTLLALARSIIIGKDRVNNYTTKIISNIISNNLLSKWAPDFKKVNINFLPDHTKLDLEFVPPKLVSSKDNSFIKKFIRGSKSLSSFLKTDTTININVSKKLFKTFNTPEDMVECFKNAIKYYDADIDKGANTIATMMMSFNTPTKELLSNELSGLVLYPLSLLFVFQNIDGTSNKTFASDMKLVRSLNKSIKSIVMYINPRKNSSKSKLDYNLSTITKIVNEISSNVTYTDNIKLLKDLPNKVSKLYKGDFDNIIKESFSRLEFEQCDSYGDVIIIFNEAVRPKRLKKIPSDLIPYIIIEGESIRDANDKMIITSYAFSKLEIIDWYIQLLEVGSKNYIVPHTKPQLELIRTELLAAIKKIMNTPIPRSDRPIIDINYPKNYEG